MPAPMSPRPHAVVLGLILPLALAGTASAQPQTATPQTAWVDPPHRASAPAPSPGAATEPVTASKDAVRKDQPQAPSKATAQAAAADRSGMDRSRVATRRASRQEPADDALPKAAATRAPAPKRAAALERPAGHEALRHRAHHPHRLADTPAASPVPAATGSAERAAAARDFAARYFATVSGSGDTMVGAATSFYATRVRFYGRPVTTAGLVAEKRSFVERWPERRYEPRAIRTACDTETCTIRSVVDFRTANPDRGAVSSGEAELILEVGFAGTHPYILGETGRVLRRSIQAGTLAPSPGKA
ncbi:hypothetical protein ACRAWG_07345 [Methylobacterium sp. P31]